MTIRIHRRHGKRVVTFVDGRPCGRLVLTAEEAADLVAQMESAE